MLAELWAVTRELQNEEIVELKRFHALERADWNATLEEMQALLEAEDRDRAGLEGKAAEAAAGLEGLTAELAEARREVEDLLVQNRTLREVLQTLGVGSPDAVRGTERRKAKPAEAAASTRGKASVGDEPEADLLPFPTTE